MCKCAGASAEGKVRSERRQRGGRGSASRLWRRPHFPRAAAAVVRSGLSAAMLCSRSGCRCRRRCARGVRAPSRPGPRAFSHWRKATAGGLARDWSVAGRPRTWYLIGRAGSGLGSDEGIRLQGFAGLGLGLQGDDPLRRRRRAEAGGHPKGMKGEGRVLSGRYFGVACAWLEVRGLPNSKSSLRGTCRAQDRGVQAPRVPGLETLKPELQAESIFEIEGY